MSRVNTNNFGLQYAVEDSIGVLPGSPSWKLLEPNSIGAFGASISTVARRPISRDRGRKKGTVTDLDSAVEFEGDVTMDSVEDFVEGFMFSQFTNVEFDLKSTLLPPPVASSTTWTVTTISTALGAKLQYAALGPWPLVYGAGYTNAANNGLHQLTVDPANPDTTLTTDSTLVVETPSVNASLQVAGVRCAIGDLALVVSGSTATITSAADISDWATLGLTVGQYIHIGSDDGAGAGARQNMFDDGSAGDVYGYARITQIDNAVLTLDKLDTNLDTSDASNATLVDIMFGRFVRNVAVTAASADNMFLERTYQIEGSFPDLGGVGTDEYEYAIGNFANELSLNLPLAEKATASWGFVGTNADDITQTRKTNAATAKSPLRTTALNTSSDIASISTDVISSASDVYFKSLTLTIGNNVSPEKSLGTLGASFVNAGMFEVGLEGQMIFSDKAIVNAVKNNTTVTFASIIKNDNGAVAIDIPAMTLGGGDREYPVDQTVLVNIAGEAFNDPTGTIPNVALGISLFPTVPTSRV